MARADDMNPAIRVSDAERDTVATELGQHFQDGRLDQAEFDERVTAAMAARTRRDLEGLLTDLPSAAGRSDSLAAGQAAGTTLRGRARQWSRVLAVLPLILAAVVVGGMLTGGWHHGWPFAPLGFLWLLIPVLAVRAWLRSSGRRQWR
jgi:hypothetical protein